VQQLARAIEADPVAATPPIITRSNLTGGGILVVGNGNVIAAPQNAGPPAPLPPPPRLSAPLPNPVAGVVPHLNAAPRNIGQAERRPRPGAPNLVEAVEPMIEEDSDDEIIVDGPEVIDANGKRTRTARKYTYWNFVDKIDHSTSYCKCGCIDTDGVFRKKYATPTTGAIKRHVEKVHPDLFSLFTNCKNHMGNLNELDETIARLDDSAVKKTAKRRRVNAFGKAIDLEKSVVENLNY
jgi:hypothetical protein